MKKINIGLVGCGRIAEQHFWSIKKLPAFHLTHVCDNIPERAEKAALDYGAQAHLKYTDIPTAELDVISIATPNYLHYEMAKHFLERGVHVVLEKPMTINVKHSAHLVTLAEKHDQDLFAVKQVRFNPAVRAIKTITANGSLGKPLSCNLTMHWTRPQKYFESDLWRGKKDMDGGTFINQGIHYIDLLVWIFGPVESVYAVTATLNHTIEVEDHVSAILRFANGAIGTVEFNVNTYPHNLDCSIFLQGSNGSVKVGGAAANELEVWEVADIPRPAISEGFAPNVYAGGLYQGSCPNHIYVYENVADVLSGKSRQVATSGASALETHKVIEAIYTSAQLGRAVAVQDI